MSSPIILQENSTFGEFKLVKLLGRGGMAEVYYAQSAGVGGFQRNLALKVIHPQLSHDQEFVQMLIDEAKLSAQLNHPNIVHIHNLGQVQGVYYIAMELIDGCDVYQALVRSEEREERFPTDVAAWIAHEACAGLYYAHSRQDHLGKPLNIIHRDISPQNLQLSREGEVKIVDFGIAKAEQRNSHTQQGVIKGKYSYMSPEQAWGDEIDHRSDIFSLGICLYEMIAGEILYDADDGLGLLEQVRLAQIPNLRSIRPDVEPELEQIVYRSLAAEPQQRFQSAEEMRVALASYLFRTGVTSGRQRLTHFLSQLRIEELPRTASAPEEIDEHDGATQAVSASMFESLKARHMQNSTPSVGVNGGSLIPSLQSDTQEATRALSADAFAQLQGGGASVSEPQEATRALSADAFAQLHGGGVADLDTQEATRALSADAFAQLQGGLDPIPDTQEATRALSAEAFAQLNTPTPLTSPSVLSQTIKANDFSQQEATRALNAQDFDGLKPTEAITDDRTRALDQGTPKLPTPPLISAPAAGLPGLSPFGGNSFQAEAHTRAVDLSSQRPSSSPVQALGTTPSPFSHPASPSPLPPSASPPPPVANLAPPPFSTYASEESTRAVDLQQLKSASAGPTPYQKQVLRDTFSIPRLPDTPVPEVPSSPSPFASAVESTSTAPETFPDPTPASSPDPMPAIVSSPDPSPVSVPSPHPAPSPDPAPAPAPAPTQDSSVEPPSTSVDANESTRSKRRREKSEEKNKEKTTPRPKTRRKGKGKGQRKSIASYVLIAGVVILLIVGGVTLASKLLKPPAPKAYTLRVTSPNAKGARVYLDGGDTGLRTAALLQQLKPDVEYLIKLSAPGYESKEKRVLISSEKLAAQPNQEQVVRISLPRAKGTLRVTSTPSGATVMMGDQYLGKTPITKRGLNRSDAAVRVIFRHPKCKQMSRVFMWREEIESSIDVKLKCSR